MNRKIIKNWDEIFIGRKAIVEKLLGNRKDFFIFGARRIGKTALLKFVEEKFWNISIPGFYFSIQGDLSSEKIKRRIEYCFKRKMFNVPNFKSNNLKFFNFLEELDLRLTKQNIVLLSA